MSSSSSPAPSTSCELSSAGACGGAGDSSTTSSFALGAGSSAGIGVDAGADVEPNENPTELPGVLPAALVPGALPNCVAPVPNENPDDVPNADLVAAVPNVEDVPPPVPNENVGFESAVAASADVAAGSPNLTRGLGASDLAPNTDGLAHEVGVAALDPSVALTAPGVAEPKALGLPNPLNGLAVFADCSASSFPGVSVLGGTMEGLGAEGLKKENDDDWAGGEGNFEAGGVSTTLSSAAFVMEKGSDFFSVVFAVVDVTGGASGFSSSFGFALGLGVLVVFDEMVVVTVPEGVSITFVNGSPSVKSPKLLEVVVVDSPLPRVVVEVLDHTVSDSVVLDLEVACFVSDVVVAGGMKGTNPAGAGVVLVIPGVIGFPAKENPPTVAGAVGSVNMGVLGVTVLTSARDFGGFFPNVVSILSLCFS